MARKHNIIGLGEALLREYPDRTEAAGLAASVAIHASRLGHTGIAISRLGQDQQADELLSLLGNAGVNTAHIQSDPDLPTGRVTFRAIGGPSARYLDTRAAFDNLQSDFDLEDVAQQADAVVFGMLTRRSGQTRSEENRFLETCGAALKVFDLTNRGGESDNSDSGSGLEDGLDRGHAASGLDLCDLVIVDRQGVDALRPQSASSSLRDAALDLLRESPASCVLAVQPAAGHEASKQATEVEGYTADGSATVVIPMSRTALEALVVALLVGLLNGKDFESSLEAAGRVGTHAHEHPGEPAPAEWLG